MSASTTTNLRIIALPLTRPRRSLPSAASPRLTYYQFQLNVKAKQRPSPTGSEVKSGWLGLPKEGIVKWASRRASDSWAGFGKAPGGWKLKLYQAGERLVDRMDFEELALKSIDASLAPSITRKRLKELENKNEGSEKEQVQFPLLYPPSILSSSAVLSELLAYTEHRIPKHRRGFYLWMAVAPITAPFMLIPIIPNIPFFFCVWRSWSHYRAYRSSQLLQSLLQQDAIVPEPNESLDSVYKLASITASPSPTDLDSPPSTSSNASHPSETTSSAQAEHELLLTRDAIPEMLKAVDIAENPTAAADLCRAVEQARLRVQGGRVGS